MAKAKTLFACSECGHETAKWYGKCPSCGAWNSMYEVEAAPVAAKAAAGTALPSSLPVPISEIDVSGEDIRTSTGIGELDRVLGGGTVLGSLVLVGGEPGIGKSTLLLQICSALCAQGKVLYVSGEESQRQLKLRAQRLGVNNNNLYVHAETRLDTVLSTAEKLSPSFMIVDSIQTVYRTEVASAPGSSTQIRECTMSLMQYAKSMNVTVFIVGHVTKEGTLAGPKILEHMVDCVLYFEGDRHASYRIIRAVKNRFGSTDEIGVFEMGSHGLMEVPNPSQALLEGRPKDVPGSCISCVMEGSRPILAEIQALVSETSYGNPRRTADGFDYNRAVLLLAVLEKRAGLMFGGCDTYLNVTGGLHLAEPAADLPAVLALASSMRNWPLPENLAAFGEVGLTGELRSVMGTAQRLVEIRRLGFSACICPRRSCLNVPVPEGLHVIPVDTVRDAIDMVLGPERGR
ncbi:MAG: DNA repair protein RadA [Ruminococcaceae bacterium]|nr:DNA repair protein RadA [Oscillospiraceae bacterium]